MRQLACFPALLDVLVVMMGRKGVLQLVFRKAECPVKVKSTVDDTFTEPTNQLEMKRTLACLDRLHCNDGQRSRPHNEAPKEQAAAIGVECYGVKKIELMELSTKRSGQQFLSGPLAALRRRTFSHHLGGSQPGSSGAGPLQ